MLLNDIVKKAKEKPVIDWDAYCQWQVLHSGGFVEEKRSPVVWKCTCGAVGSFVTGEKYGTCRHCGLVFLALAK